MYNVLDQDFAHKLFLMYTEFGIFIHWQFEIQRKCNEIIMKQNRFYHTTKEYVDDVISFDNLGIGNFYGIFKAYFLFCLLVLIVFVLHIIIKFILSKRKRIAFILYLNFQRLMNIKNRIVSFCKAPSLELKHLLH